MKIPNPKNYDFLWLVYNHSFFETSLWLIKECLKRDFLVTGKGAEWKVYIGKKERDRLANLGLLFFEKYFRQYRLKVNKEIKKSFLFFREITSAKLSSLSNSALRKDFLKTVNFVQSLWVLYFFTEYFLYDKIQMRIERDRRKNKKLVKKVKEMQELKFNFRKIINKTVFKGNIFEKYFKEIEERTKRKDLSLLHYREIAELLSGKKVKKFNRQNYVWGKFNNWRVIDNRKALKIINEFDNFLLSRASGEELKGQVANKGYYKGKVKIIPFDIKKDLTKEISKMKKGEVLVTGSTGPDMILACQKAGAIITEEGGIASHAAIVSRELGIPCIIGTKIATQVLKDGDLVEVDATSGVIKIIK